MSGRSLVEKLVSVFQSVQPDAASPMHVSLNNYLFVRSKQGKTFFAFVLWFSSDNDSSSSQGHNWIIVYSRPVYFCLCCMMIWVFDLSGRAGSLQPFSLYGVTFFSADFLLCVRDMLIGQSAHSDSQHVNNVCIGFMPTNLICLSLAPQSLPCVSQLFSSSGCYLRSILLWCVCWSRLTCTFSVEPVGARNGSISLKQPCDTMCIFDILSVCFSPLSYYQSALVPV